MWIRHAQGQNVELVYMSRSGGEELRQGDGLNCSSKLLAIVSKLFSTIALAAFIHIQPFTLCACMRFKIVPHSQISHLRLSHKLLCTYRSIYNRSWRTNELTESHRIRLLAVIFLQTNKIRCNGEYAGIEYQYREQYHDQASSCCLIGKR